MHQSPASHPCLLRLLSLSILVIPGLLLTGCLDGGSFSVSPTSTTALTISTESGTKQALEGIWFYCTGNAPDPDTGDRHFFSGSDFTSESYQYPSTDGSCSGQPIVTQYTDATLSSSDDFATTGWIDSTGTASLSPPANEAGTGQLAPNPQVTMLSLATGNSTPADTAAIVNTYYYMDDTADIWVIYRADGPDEDLNDYPDYVADYNPLRKEGVTRTPLATLINAESGTMQLLDGYWQRECQNAGDTDFREQHVIAAGTLKLQRLDYTSTDTSCSSGETTTTTQEGTIITGENVTTLGWHDGTVGGATVPISQAGVDPLAAQPIITRLTATITSGIETGTFFIYYYMDDTAAIWCLYRDEGPNDITVTHNEYVANFDPLCKVSIP